MKKLLLLAIPATLIASPAFAQASGSVAVTGVVGGRCAALTPITGTIDLGELSQTNGTIASTFPNNVGGLSKQFTIVCTSANSDVSITATPLDNTGDNTTAGGYTGRVHYTATTVFNLSSGGTHTYIYGTSIGGTLAAPLGGRPANQPNNVTLTVSNGQTSNTGDLLKAGTYNGAVTITVSPL